jgi:hypothetical protein
VAGQGIGAAEPEQIRHAGSLTGRRIGSYLVACLVRDPTAVRGDPRSLDEMLWLGRATGRPVRPPPTSDGPLTGVPDDAPLEVWTETELAALHAAWWMPAWRPAAEKAARWLIREIQPDNATNLPWAVHVFVELSIRFKSLEADLYAQTLLHNAMAGRARADALASLILLDAASYLDQLEIG